MQEAKALVYQMPATDNEVPVIFRSEDRDLSDVEFLESDEQMCPLPAVHTLDS